VVYNDQKVSRIDLSRLGNSELVKLATSRNEFKSRHARRILQERAQHGAIPEVASLKTILRSTSATSPERLRALWTLHVTTGLDARTVIENLRSPDEYVRAWTIQIAFESRENLARLVREATEQNLRPDPSIYELAENDPSPVVRLYLAAAAQRAPEEVRARLVRTLLQRSEDAGDHNIPLMLWVALDPLAADYPQESLASALETKLPKILNFTTRRVAALDTAEARDLVAQKIGATENSVKQLEMLTGLAAALRGQRSVTMPGGWKAIETKLANSPNAEIRTIVQTLSLTFGSQDALASLRKTLTDPSATVSARRSALDSLVSVRDSELPPVLQRLLADRDLRGPALRALGGYNDPNTPAALLEAYDSFEPVHKRDALNTLVSRPAFAKPLLAAISANKVPAHDLSADIVRQLRNHKEPEIQEQVATFYGAVREASADAKAEIERYRRIYRAGGSQPGDASKGRAVYNQICAQCHMLFDSGGTAGPDITGAARHDLNYLLENMVDPNAVIPNDYRTTEIETTDDRSIVGIVKKQDDNSVTIQTANEVLVIPRNEIESMRQTELSMMPEGLLSPLTDQEVRDLIYYLTRVGQVPLPVQSAARSE
jgi:putative heme-binding domain-containing protein